MVLILISILPVFAQSAPSVNDQIIERCKFVREHSAVLLQSDMDLATKVKIQHDEVQKAIKARDVLAAMGEDVADINQRIAQLELAAAEAAVVLRKYNLTVLTVAMLDDELAKRGIYMQPVVPPTGYEAVAAANRKDRTITPCTSW